METVYGYAGKILKVDLSSGTVNHIPTVEYADRFLGGRGIAAKSTGMKYHLRSVPSIPRTA